MKEAVLPARRLEEFPPLDGEAVRRLLAEACQSFGGKIVVLDDDPTGVQTVHDISVYTDWTRTSVREGFLESSPIFFLLTNSRSFSEERTKTVHESIGRTVERVSRELEIPYVLISRSDSTLRGHFPLETETLRRVIREERGRDVDGEILCPYFREGGRFTIDQVHYVRYADRLVPAADTEFAADATFGYRHSELGEYVEEKTAGSYKKENCLRIPLSMIRRMDLEGIERILRSASGFQKILVDAVADEDVMLVAACVYRAMAKGKSFLFRSAAAMAKAMGNISSRPLLTREEMVRTETGTGGLIVVGSHTKKTTLQLERLKERDDLLFVELNSDLVLEGELLNREVERVLSIEEKALRERKTVCVSTKRKLLTLKKDTKEEALARSVRISEALKDCVGRLTVRPAYVIAKGGITSSDVGVKALRVHRARVLGQIEPGIPVWQTGEESLFPGMAYVIFPGNVGEEDTLLRAVATLQGRSRQ